MPLVRTITIVLALITTVAAGTILNGYKPGFLGKSDNKATLENSTSNDLIMAWDASHEPASLDGHIEPYQPGWLIDSFIADPLLVIGPDGEFYPALATSWSSSHQHRSSTLELDILVNGSYYPVRFQAQKNLQLDAASILAVRMWSHTAGSNNLSFAN
jgi:ABC-type transport system substrate-binding protein